MNLEDEIIGEIKKVLIPDINKIIVKYVGIYTLSDEFRSVDKNPNEEVISDTLSTLNFLPKNCINLVNQYYYMSVADIYRDNVVIDNNNNNNIIISNVLENQYWDVNKVEIVHKDMCSSAGFGRRARVEINHKSKNNYVNNIVLCLRINKLLDIEDIIYDIALEIGGCRIDKIYGVMFCVLYKLYDLRYKVTKHENYEMYDYEIPVPFDLLVNGKATMALYNQETSIHIEFIDSKNKNIEMDDEWCYARCNIIEVIPNIILPFNYRVLINQLQYTGDEVVEKSYNYYNYKIFFNHKVYFLVLLFGYEYGEYINSRIKEDEDIVDTIDLTIEDENYLTAYKPQTVEDLKGIYFIPTHSLNFSKVRDSTLKIKFSDALKNALKFNIRVDLFAFGENIMYYKVQNDLNSKCALWYSS